MSYTSEDVGRSAVDTPVEWQDLKLKYFRKMIDLCRENDIKLVVVYSPWYMKTSSESYQNLTKLCRENDIPVFDYYDGSMFNYKAEYFADQSHLNLTGANAFSKEIAHRLKLMF